MDPKVWQAVAYLLRWVTFFVLRLTMIRVVHAYMIKRSPQADIEPSISYEEDDVNVLSHPPIIQWDEYNIQSRILNTIYRIESPEAVEEMLLRHEGLFKSAIHPSWWWLLLLHLSFHLGYILLLTYVVSSFSAVGEFIVFDILFVLLILFFTIVRKRDIFLLHLVSIAYFFISTLIILFFEPVKVFLSVVDNINIADAFINIIYNVSIFTFILFYFIYLLIIGDSYAYEVCAVFCHKQALYILFIPIVHIFFLRKIRSRVQKKLENTGNIKLLLLRVFGPDENNIFTFGRIMRLWRNIGSFMTIVDPGYIKFEHGRLLSRPSLSLFITSELINSIVFAIALPSDDFMQIDNNTSTIYLVILTYIITSIIAISSIFVVFKKRFPRNHCEIIQRLRKTFQRNFDKNFIYRGLVMYCFDNTWKLAVRDLIQHADCILMDLRGYSASRKGCEYELGLIANYMPIEKVVFLLDDDPNKDFIYSSIERKLTAMRIDSPNAALQQLSIVTYTILKNKASNRLNVQKLLLLLTAAALKTQKRHITG